MLTVKLFLISRKKRNPSIHTLPLNVNTPINNSGVLPPLEYKTNGRLASVNIKEDVIYLISKNFNPEKAHGWDNISIRMIQLCGKAVVEPLRIFFLSFLEGCISR